MPTPVIKVQSNIRQPVISHRTTGLNATRVPSAERAAHIVAPHARQTGKTQPATAIPGVIVGKRTNQ